MVHRSELSGLTKKKHIERPSESWRTIDQDTLKVTGKYKEMRAGSGVLNSSI